SIDGHIEVLLFERIIDAMNFHDIWQTQNLNVIRPLLNALVVELATQHVLGIVQNDLHFKNFLIVNEKIYTIDGSDIELQSHLIEKDESIKNLALFMAQLGSKAKHLQDDLFKIYAKARGWLL